MLSSVPGDQSVQREVTYTFSHEDYLHFIDFWTKRNRRKYIWQIIRVFLLLLAGYIVLLLLSNVAAVYSVVLGTVMATITGAGLLWARRRRMRRVREKVLGERMTRVGPDGIFGRFPQFEVLNYWKGISEIAEDDGYLYLFTGGSRAHVVPKRAFVSATDLEQFCEAARSYWKSSREPLPTN